MSTPTFDIKISGSVIAIYGAVVATATAIFQIVNFFRDRVEVRVTVQRNVKMSGPYGYLSRVQVTNTGRRPVTVMKVGAYRLYPHRAFLALETTPALPHELTEGKCVTAMVDLEEPAFENIESWQAYDAVGRTYSLHVAPWYKRWYSRRRRKKEAKKSARAKGQGAGA